MVFRAKVRMQVLVLYFAKLMCVGVGDTFTCPKNGPLYLAGPLINTLTHQHKVPIGGSVAATNPLAQNLPHY